jgi:transcriptional regulator with GAF, ATPase, and Fis domain
MAMRPPTAPTDTVAAEREPRTEIEAADVVVVEGPDAGAHAPIPASGLRIGTAAGNQLRLRDPTVSRIHCELRPKKGCVQFTDSGSTNGSVANGVRVRDADLHPGDTVRLGGTTVRLQAAAEKLFIPLSSRTKLGGLVGASTEMRRIYAILERVAPTHATVLVCGETGTGKELVVRAIHELSPRAGKPLVPVDCGSIAPNLLESELFGHVRGAFSGATGDRRGLFEQADGGTIFLDEIGELPLPMQAKLLRVLESREVRRVGSNAVKTVDVRVVAATNRTLAAEVNSGGFREDLFHRLAVVEIELPPLRARREDIPLLAQHFYEKLIGKSAPLPLELLATLPGRSFSGNVRELRNVIERAVSLGVLESGAHAAQADGAPQLGAVSAEKPMLEARQAWIDQFESAYVRALLERTGGNVTQAARQAGVSRRFLQTAMRRLGLRGED